MHQQGDSIRDRYARRLDELARESVVAAARARAWRIALVVLVVVAAGLAYLSFGLALLPWWTTGLLLPVAALGARQVGHWRDRGVHVFTVAEYYSTGVARLDRNWDVLDSGEEFIDREHLYAIDLDLFGRGSLFQLLCATRTQAGREVLAGWMTLPANADEVTARHAASAELRGRPELRERLAAVGGVTASDCHPDMFRTWVNRSLTHRRFAPWAPTAAFLLSLSIVGVPAAFLLGLMTATTAWLAATVIVVLSGILGIAYLPRIRATVREWRLPSTELAVVWELLRLLEREDFSSTKLRTLAQRLRAANAFRRVRRLRRLIEWAEARDVPIFAAASNVLLWGTQFSMAIQRWHVRHGTELLTWLTLVGEFEALMSLATYSDEHPDDVLPELSTSGPLVDAEGLGHPLVAQSTCVRNDLRLDDDVRFLIVSGSNMSGKSTLLRAVGLNVVLAWMGAPVKCRRLVVSALTIGAAIRVNDSVVDGRSHFFAEVDRLRRMMTLAGSSSVLFLIDEIMGGTNSHDRRIAAEWVVRALIAHNAVGLITTHDLALTQIASSVGGGDNVHFDDRGDQGPLEFDYRLRPGVVTRSNALNIVRMLGLDPSL